MLWLHTQAVNGRKSEVMKSCRSKVATCRCFLSIDRGLPLQRMPEAMHPLQWWDSLHDVKTGRDVKIHTFVRRLLKGFE